MPASVTTRLKALGVAVASAALVLAGAPAAGAAPPPAAANATAAGTAATSAVVGYQIRSVKAPGRCIGISNGLAGLWNCTRNPDQSWHWSTAQSGVYKMLINGNGQCLAVNGGSTANGARILGYRCTGSTDQYWYERMLDYHKNLYFNMKSGKVIGVASGSTANGAAVVQWQTAGTDQWWYMG